MDPFELAEHIHGILMIRNEAFLEDGLDNQAAATLTAAWAAAVGPERLREMAAQIHEDCENDGGPTPMAPVAPIRGKLEN
jgi:hypothetical protein